MMAKVGGDIEKMPADEVGAENPQGIPNLDHRLVRVFETVFPELPLEGIRTASVSSIEDWDSLQSVVLMTLVEEEFGITISPLDLPELASYEAVREYVVKGGGE